MSIAVSSAVWERSACTGTDLLVLLAIAEFANDAGVAYPSVPTLARRCRMSPRNVNLILARLRAVGELEVRASAGPGGVNVYCVRVAAPLKASSGPLKPASPPESDVHPLKRTSAPLKPTSSTPEADFIPPLKPASDKPSLNRHEPSEIRREQRSAPKRPIPEGWQPSPKDIATATQERPDLNLPEVVARFRDYWIGEGKSKADWSATFRNWVRREGVGKAVRANGRTTVRHTDFDEPGYYERDTDVEPRLAEGQTIDQARLL